MIDVILNEEITVKNLPQNTKRSIKKLLTIPNPDYIKKIRMKLWLGNTPHELSVFKENEQDLILPYGFQDELINILLANGLEYRIIDHTKIPYISVLYKGNIKLYDYQQNGLQAILRGKNGILISPCGSGKTMIGLHLIKELGLKALWVTHTLDLLRQSMRVAKSLYDNDIGNISGGKVNIGEITFATVQTLSNIDLDKLRDEFGVIIVDEAHRCVGTPTSLTMFYKVLSSLNARHKYGLTATLCNDKNDIKYMPVRIIGEVLHEIKESEIKRINAEHIPVKLSTPTSDEYLKTDKTLDFHALTNYLVYNEQRNLEILSVLLEYRNNHNLVLSTRNAHIEALYELLKEFGEKPVMLVGATRAKERVRILKEFKEGKHKYLLSNYQLAKEGLDLPIADTLHLVFPIRDKVALVQSKGRVERLFKGKESARVIDYVDTQIPYCRRTFNERKRILK